jgi:hypothetical protein
MKRYLFAVVVSLAVPVAHATALADNPCGLPDPQEYIREPICTNLSCVPTKEARAKEVEAAAKCEFERLQPPGAGLAPPPQVQGIAPAQAQ